MANFGARRIISISIVALLVLMVGGFNISLYLLYKHSVDTLNESLGQRLLSVGRAIEPHVETTLEEDLIGGRLSLPDVILLEDYFVRVRDADQLSGIYLLDGYNRDLLSLEDSLSEVELFLPLHAEALGRAQLGEAGVSPLYEVGERYFKSAYQPVGSDSVLAVLLIESSFEFFTKFVDYRRHLIIVNAASIAALILIGLIILVLNRRLVRAERLLVSQAALTQMGQMTAVIAHEIRNPLGIIKATAERLRRKFAPADGDDRQLFDYIPEEVDRLNQITTHYLQFASPSDLKGAPEPIDSVLDSLLPGIIKDAARRGVTVTSAIAAGATAITVDSVAVRQVLFNLLRNALDATPTSGKVVVKVDAADGGLRILVSDTGAGLEPQQLKRIFDPFFTTKVHGTGLGLFVVKRLVDKMNGRIDVESQPGNGTVFTILIPEGEHGENSRR